ncbi:hypothetical protein DRO42_05605 [Candidatus Bathyarchaeota archaeon]|nr:MAG: hypothetical protein DRO42_05605 [Candidatus Bathyarchaeota archaeon]
MTSLMGPASQACDLGGRRGGGRASPGRPAGTGWRREPRRGGRRSRRARGGAETGRRRRGRRLRGR